MAKKKTQSRNKDGRFRNTDIRTLYKRYQEGYNAKEVFLKKNGMAMESQMVTYIQFKALRDARANTNKINGTKHSTGMGMVKDIIDRNAYKVSRSQAAFLQRAFEKTGAGSYSIDKIRKGAQRGDEFFMTGVESLKDEYRSLYEEQLRLNGGNVRLAREKTRELYPQTIGGSP